MDDINNILKELIADDNTLDLIENPSAESIDKLIDILEKRDDSGVTLLQVLIKIFQLWCENDLKMLDIIQDKIGFIIYLYLCIVLSKDRPINLDCHTPITVSESLQRLDIFTFDVVGIFNKFEHRLYIDNLILSGKSDFTAANSFRILDIRVKIKNYIVTKSNNSIYLDGCMEIENLVLKANVKTILSVTNFSRAVINNVIADPDVTTCPSNISRFKKEKNKGVIKREL